MQRVVVFGCVAGLLAGCVSAPERAPSWYAEREAALESGYPSLREVPRSSTANVDQRHWNQVEAELLAAGQQMKDNPRAAPASEGQDPQAFIDEARRDLEETRQAHEP
jgi:hypothetical protein